MIDFVNIYHLKDPILFNKDPIFLNTSKCTTYSNNTNLDLLLKTESALHEIAHFIKM